MFSDCIKQRLLHFISHYQNRAMSQDENSIIGEGWRSPQQHLSRQNVKKLRLDLSNVDPPQIMVDAICYLKNDNNIRRRRIGSRRKSMVPLSFSLILWMTVLLLLPSSRLLCFAGSSHNHKSYYDILGVSKNSDEKDIKKAYRKLALKHHPDKGGDEEKFKEISKAWETLSNPQQKEIYDMYGEAGIEQGATGPNAGAFGGQNFQSFFTGGQGGQGGGGGPSFSQGGDNPFQSFFFNMGPGQQQ